MIDLPFIARVDPDMFDEEGNMVRTKKYDFDDNNYVPPEAVIVVMMAKRPQQQM